MLIEPGEDEDDNDATNLEYEHLMDQADFLGHDHNPMHRKEHLKPKDLRLMRANKKSGGTSMRKVRALVDFVEYRRSHHYQMQVNVGAAAKRNAAKHTSSTSNVTNDNTNDASSTTTAATAKK